MQEFRILGIVFFCGLLVVVVPFLVEHDDDDDDDALLGKSMMPFSKNIIKLCLPACQLL